MDVQTLLENKFYQYYPHTLLQFQVHLVEHCNLKCSGCLHFSPLAEEEFLDIKEYEQDCNRLSELFDSEAGVIHLLGGEPLLHPNLVEFMHITRAAFPTGRIILLTNALLLPSMDEQFWRACHQYRIEVTPSRYPVQFDYSVWKDYAQKFDVFYNLEDQFKDKTQMCRIQISPKGDQPVEKNFYNCWKSAGICTTLSHGRIYPCDTAAYAPSLKKYFDLDIHLSKRNSVDIYSVNSAEELMRKLASPIPFCRYCNLEGLKFFENWSVSKKDWYEWIAFEWSEKDIQYLKNTSSVYVYGTGEWGMKAVSRLYENGVQAKALVVTHEEDIHSVCGVPVVKVSDVKLEDKSAVCLIAVSNDAQTELERSIHLKGFKEVIFWPNLEGNTVRTQFLKNSSSVYIYGAGVWGTRAVAQLKKNGIDITAILVTDKENNPNAIHGIPVINIRDVEEVSPTDVCILAVDISARSEISNKVRQCGFERVIPLFEV